MIFASAPAMVEAQEQASVKSGGRPKGALIAREFFDDLKSGEVTIAVKTFIRYNDKYSTMPSSRLPQGKISLHLDEQKLPPMGDDLVFKSASVVPMLSTNWQSKQDPEIAENNPKDNLFRYNGKFVSNPKIMGKWKLIAEVTDPTGFDAEKKRGGVRDAPFSTITFGAGGQTSEPIWAWSDETLMDPDRYQALNMRLDIAGETECLFVESGGFCTRNKPLWKSQG